MAKRELSSTLKNLKFMQRATQREEKTKKEEEVKPDPDGSFAFPNTQSRKCMVIMEGNPHPGALRGRMSFQSFNPSIDKLNEAAANLRQPQASTTSSGDEKICDRENGSLPIASEGSNVSRPDSDADGDHKRKQPEIVTETEYPNKSSSNASGEADQRSSPNNSKSSRKQQKREKLDWNLLRPPKPLNKRG